MSAVLMNPEIDIDSAKRRMIEFTLRAPTEADESGRIEILEVAPRIAYIAVRPSYRAEALYSAMIARLLTRSL